ncbi:MAG TPA: alpha/beta fold hydrolase [Lapillicoccus sp.]|nr:alpha/beta fold hydrolase [Lapillicoccus sp.]
MSQYALPDGVASSAGVVDRDGVRLSYAVSGDGPVTVLLLPTWSIIPSRFWKLQVPYLSRHYRVVTFDGRGSGDSGRPAGAHAYGNAEYAADALAVLDATGTDRAVVVGLSCAGSWSVHLAAEHPERVSGIVALSPACGFDIPNQHRDSFAWDERLDTTEGWAKYNKHYWVDGDYDDFVRFFFAQMFVEPHSTKQIEDCVGWAHEIAPQTLADTTAGRLGVEGAVCEPIEPLCRRVLCPVLVIHGTRDHIRPHAYGERLAELTGGELLTVRGAGHGIMARDPVLVSEEIRAFVDRVHPPVVAPRTRTRVRAPRREPRALYLSSPIGLGHARRDVAVAAELRRLHPDLRIDWLAQHPVTRVLAEAGETVHPASRWLVNESTHIESESGEHDLNAFQAIRRMDAILVNNFGVFRDLLDEEPYDLVIADEAWDVDYFLHENPQVKRAPLAWMTDFVGWLPMPEGGDAEAALTADYNAEMIEQRARFRAVRDRSVFVGNESDIVDASFGPGLPRIRDWTSENFDYAGYVTGFEPTPPEAREELRARLGYRPDERVCVVTVGGSGVGAPLLRRVLDAVPLVRRGADDLRFVVVAGPRIDPESLPTVPGAEVRGFVPDLVDHLAVCDVAVVQGGLSTTMELTANRRPFVYVPLRRHFEQNLHVRHRLEGYGAGTGLDYEVATDPDALAAAVVGELDRVVDYKPVESDGAARAAALIGSLL